MTVAAAKTNNENQSLKNMVTIFAWLAVFCAVLFAGYKMLTQKDVLPIKEISFSGELKQISAQQLHSLIVDGVSGNFFTLSVDELYHKFYTLPWVEQIWIHRVWPDKINIEIKEHEPVAILKDKGLLNAQGKVFTPDVGQFKNVLPIFSVANNYEQEAIAKFKMYEAMLAENNIRIRKFVFDKRKSQVLFLSNNMQLKLGRADSKKRLARFVKAYDAIKISKKRSVESIDLRYTNGFAVKWKQV